MPTRKSESNKNKTSESNKTRKSKSKESKSKESKSEETDFVGSLNKKEKQAIATYQDGSFEINGFLRKGYSSLKTQAKIKNVLSNIATLDNIFNKPDCPKTDGTMILYRGTPAFYENENKAYTSCSKTIDALFDMQFKHNDSILSIYNPCCINILKLDAGIPYLDLENFSEEWKYQREVLLPRGLIAINTSGKEGEITEYTEYTINNKTFKFKTYTFIIEQTENTELPVDDRLGKAELKSKKEFIEKQRDEIIKLYNTFFESSDFDDAKDELSELMEYLYDSKEFTTQGEFKKISDKILKSLKIVFPLMKNSDIVKESCKKQLDAILAKVNSMDNLTEIIAVQKC